MYIGPQIERTIDSYGEWVKVFRHDASNSSFYSSDNDWAEAKQTNTSNPNGEKYSILSEWGRFLKNDKYTLKLDYPNDSLTNIWSQTSNPVDSDGSGGVDGYVAIAIDTTAQGWGGLERRDSQTSTFLDGTINPSPSNWYYAVGSRVSWGGSASFPGPSSAVSLVELWMLYKPV